MSQRKNGRGESMLVRRGFLMLGRKFAVPPLGGSPGFKRLIAQEPPEHNHRVSALPSRHPAYILGKGDNHGLFSFCMIEYAEAF